MIQRMVTHVNDYNNNNKRINIRTVAMCIIILNRDRGNVLR